MSTYIELCINPEDVIKLYLRVPTKWDHATKTWSAFIKTPKSDKLIYGEGTDAIELQYSFTTKMADMATEDSLLASEIVGMFQPLSYWDEMETI